MARGAYDVIDAREPGAVARLAQRIAELATVEAPVPVTDRFVAASDAARSVLREVAQAARTSMPVLLTGETGTGKEVAARLLHEWSPRRSAPVRADQLRRDPNELIEAELFGYVKRRVLRCGARATTGSSRRPRAAPCFSTRSTTRR